MKKCAELIENDVFGIAARLKSIDDGYFVLYDKRACAFEVHNVKQRGDTFSLRIPYPCLDARTVTLVLKTRAENAKKLFEEMERENAATERKQNSRVLNSAISSVEEILRKNGRF